MASQVLPDQPATGQKAPVGAALVVGGGIAGIQAALDLAESGIRVYLVEKGPSLGGRMAQLDKTFPTNDCAICILSPKLVEAARHPNIEVLTKTDLLAVEGQAGDFTVRVRQHPRYVSIERCTACDDCTKVCPVEVPNEFDEGLSKRKAIYRPYAQAVPNAFVIDKVGRAPCTAACPAGVSAQGYIALIRQKRYADALHLIRERIPFPGVCGRTCHHPCEGQCNRRYVDEPVAIQALKRFVTDWIYRNPLPPSDPAPRTRPQRVAIVGSGPAGLTAAQDLVKMGYGVTVFEALPEAGGMMRVGIPEHRLPKDVLNRDIADILALGVELRLNTPIRNPLALRDEGYDAIYLAVGVYEEPRLRIEGEELQGVISAISFLREGNLGRPIQPGKRVAVVGGGITAVDAATTALRLGAKEVYLIYRRGRDQIPAYGWELEAAESEGVTLIQWTVPLRILGDAGRVTGLECAKTQMHGQDTLTPVPGTEFTLPVDTVIRALGQASDLWHMDDPPNKWLGDPQTLATRYPGIFATPGRMPGAGFVVNAIAQGHQAAISIHRYLQGEPLAQESPEVPVAKWTREEAQAKVEQDQIAPISRQPRTLLPPTDRTKSFAEIDLGFTEEQALAEAERCLGCGLCSECYMCVLACKAHAIDHQQVPVERELRVGAVLLAPGYAPYDPQRAPELGWGRYANVLTSLQFERMLSASGLTHGHLARPSDGQEPRRIAFLQCVGSRDQEHDYCSSVCCMYATKEAMLALEHAPGVECTIFQMDMRAFSKGFDAYYQRARDLGVRYVRNRVSALKEDPRTRNLILQHTDGDENTQEETFDLVVLSVGMEPPTEGAALATQMGIRLDRAGFCQGDTALPVATSRPGIFACGTFAGPKDIPETVVEASAAAGAALAEIGPSRGTLVEPRAYPPEREVTPAEEPRIGVFVCSCGNNIAGVVDVAQVVAYAQTLPGVVHAENTTYSCSPDALLKIQEAIREKRLNRLVVASCTPRTHEPLFRDTARQAGLNPFLFEMANIRDQDSWVHPHEPERATEKAKDLVRAAVARSHLLAPLHTRPQSLHHTALVVGGGVAGMTAALNLARQGFGVYLVEREGQLGGHARRLGRRVQGGAPLDLVRSLEEAIRAEPRLKVLLNHEPVKFEGFVGNFRTWVQERGTSRQRLLEHGVTVIATGAREYRGPAYGLGQHPRILTQADLDALLAGRGGATLEPPLAPDQWRSVVMLQCVGPWDEPGAEAPFYCSRICCATAVKNAIALKEANPRVQVAILYHRDIRTYGRIEALYTQARRLGVIFVRYPEGARPSIALEGERPVIRVTDTVLNLDLTLEPDVLVLSEAILPAEGHRDLAELFKFSCTLEGFFLEAHVKLQPVDFPSEGLYLAGMCHYPKLVEEAQVQALAAAGRAARILSQDHLEVGGVVAVVDQAKCTGCLTCVRACPFGAIRIRRDAVGAGGILGAAEVQAAACRGCGICAGECPAKAIQLEHFRDDQIWAKIDALLPTPV